MADEKRKPTVFVRESTGLVKKVSLVDAVSLNVMGMAAGAALGSLGLTLALMPSVSGLNLLYSAIFALIFSVPVAILYTMRTRIMPRTGGDYIWMSRSFGGITGNTITFGLVIGLLSFLALITLSTVFSIGSVGVTLGYSQFLGLAVPSMNPMWQLLVGCILFIFLIAVNILRPSSGYRIISTLMIVGLFTWVLAIISLVVGGQSGVKGYMDFLNSVGANATYDSIVSSYSGGTFNLATTFSFIPFFGLFILLGTNAVPSVGSELKGSSATRWSIPISMGIAFLLLIVSFATMYAVAGLPFINGALSNLNLVLDFSFNFWTLAMGVSSNSILAGLIGIGWIFWNLGILGYGIIFISRILFAQTFDRFLPARLSYVSPRFGSPSLIHLLILVVTIIFIAIATLFYNTFIGLYGVSIGGMIYYLSVGLSSVVFALKSIKGRDRWVMAITGSLTAILFAYFSIEFIVVPVWGASTLGYLYILGSYILAMIIYFASKAHYSKIGIDITLAYKEIPPE